VWVDASNTNAMIAELVASSYLEIVPVPGMEARLAP
jgi:hypothetical protein